MLELKSLKQGTYGHAVGLCAGNFVIDINGEEIQSAFRFTTLMEINTGKAIQVKIERDGEPLGLNFVAHPLHDRADEAYKIVGDPNKKPIPPIIVTTETSHNLDVDKRLGVISAEVVYGMSVFKEVFAGFRDIFGGRVKSTQNAFSDGRKKAINELKSSAASLGADAVVGISIDYEQLGQGSSGILAIIATGTAVKLKAQSESTN